MLKGKKIQGSKMKDAGDGENVMQGMEFDLDVLAGANNMAREMAIKKLIEVKADGTEVEYEATTEAIRDFLDEIDGDFVDKTINDANKKKPIEEE